MRRCTSADQGLAVIAGRCRASSHRLEHANARLPGSPCRLVAVSPIGQVLGCRRVRDRLAALPARQVPAGLVRPARPWVRQGRASPRGPGRPLRTRLTLRSCRTDGPRRAGFTLEAGGSGLALRPASGERREAKARPRQSLGDAHDLLALFCIHPRGAR